KTPRLHAGVLLRQVAAGGLLAAQLSSAGDADPLGGPAVRLALRHVRPHLAPRRLARRGVVVLDGCYSADSSGESSGVSVGVPFGLGLMFLWGANTMIMFRPSCFAADSTKPSSCTSSASRCNSRWPSSGRDCSRPRNMMVTLTLLPCSWKRTTLRFLVS